MSIRPHRRAALAALVAGALLTAAGLAGCTASGAADGGGGSAGFSVSEGKAAAGSGASKAGVASAKTDDRSVVTTGDLDLTASDPVGAAHAIATIVTGDGGRVQTLNERPKSPASADLTVRIPSAVFGATLSTMERRWKVRTVSVHSTDVTAQVTDYGVRITNLRTSIARLQTLLAKAADTGALVEIESSLTTRQTDLEQLLAQQKDLADQVSYATLGVTVEAPAVVRHAPPSTFVSGFLAGLAGLAATAAALAVVIGVLLPWVVVAGALALVGWWAVRLVRRRRTPAPGA